MRSCLFVSFRLSQLTPRRRRRAFLGFLLRCLSMLLVFFWSGQRACKEGRRGGRGGGGVFWLLLAVGGGQAADAALEQAWNEVGRFCVWSFLV